MRDKNGPRKGQSNLRIGASNVNKRSLRLFRIHKLLSQFYTKLYEHYLTTY